MVLLILVVLEVFVVAAIAAIIAKVLVVHLAHVLEQVAGGKLLRQKRERMAKNARNRLVSAKHPHLKCLI